MTAVRERYRVDLSELQATCEANYARLSRFLPEMRSQCGVRRVALSQGDLLTGVMVLEVVEVCPYTSMVQLSQEHCLPWLPVPRLTLRVYHDARMAEVVGAEHARHFRGIYSYPNAQMHQPDEKIQLNLFLGQWLAHAQAFGHEPEVATAGFDT
ncbi:DUF1249 domain-containing protein [Pseudomonas sp. ABC1]|uniref:DUF1249 domain-containing protein n=1 Tax=Pseudomonas sp. ABC1 TaxID=2748080 RepID=UPI0015C32966|nr:DUF1249 domain-containing protein [Pseudomonas sp. ABC1]QLF93112.1 DUF1249 domain-containing protein [Pseudomonas sp. ABC1]